MVSMKNSLKLASRWISKLKSDKVDKSVFDAVYAARSLSISTNVSGTKWTVNNATAYLHGNILRVVVTPTRSAATSAGNITNEKICTITIDSQGYIKSAHDTNSVSSYTGGIAGFYTNNHTVSGNKVSFDLNIGATHAGITETRTWFHVPVTLNENAFFK